MANLVNCNKKLQLCNLKRLPWQESDRAYAYDTVIYTFSANLQAP
jgi:hypothetical protein